MKILGGSSPGSFPKNSCPTFPKGVLYLKVPSLLFLDDREVDKILVPKKAAGQTLIPTD